jgi:hypothetical protein
MLGSIVGAGLLLATVTSSEPGEQNESLGYNAVRDKAFGISQNPALANLPYTGSQYTAWQAFIGETMMTFLLVMTVLRTACNDKGIAKNNAPIGNAQHSFESYPCELPFHRINVLHFAFVVVSLQLLALLSLSPTLSSSPSTSAPSTPLAASAPPLPHRSTRTNLLPTPPPLGATITFSGSGLYLAQHSQLGGTGLRTLLRRKKKALLRRREPLPRLARRSGSW